MGVAFARAEFVRGLEPLAVFDSNRVRRVYEEFLASGADASCDDTGNDRQFAKEIENLWIQCDGNKSSVRQLPDGLPTQVFWERSFMELMGCFENTEQMSKAFSLLDTDHNGLLDVAETLGALAIMSSGHLVDRMTFVFTVFDVGNEGDMSFNELVMSLKRVFIGLRKMSDLSTPADTVIQVMAKQVFKKANKSFRESRVTLQDWHNWWTLDATVRGGLDSFTRKKEHQRGLPTADQYDNIDYGKVPDDELLALAGSLHGKHRKQEGSRRPSVLEREATRKGGLSRGGSQRNSAS
jgi:Ca2+-binding EF-hand superfamily protein